MSEAEPLHCPALTDARQPDAADSSTANDDAGASEEAAALAISEENKENGDGMIEPDTLVTLLNSLFLETNAEGAVPVWVSQIHAYPRGSTK